MNVVLNLTTGAEVKVQGSSTSTATRFFKVAFLLVFVVILLLLVWAALGALGVVHHGWPFGNGGLLGGGLDGQLDPGSTSARLPGVS